jgi:predicted SprT family Zn-dependent metalloprotease
MKLTNAERIAGELILKYCPPGWCYDWDNAKRRFGCTSFGPRIIQLSRPLTLLNDETLFTWVVKHEIAHVLAGPDAVDHGPVWRIEARKLGIKPTRCWTSSGLDAVKVEGKVVGTCKNRCGYVYRQHKITWSAYHHDVCPTCSDRRRRRWVMLDWTRDGQPLASPRRPKSRRRRYA